MKIQLQDSRGEPKLLKLVDAIAAYASDNKELERICAAIWPGCNFYNGHTHTRVMPLGKGDGEKKASIYVDLTQ